MPSSTEWDYCREVLRSSTSLDNWGLMLKSFFPRSKLIMNTIWHFPNHLLSILHFPWRPMFFDLFKRDIFVICVLWLNRGGILACFFLRVLRFTCPEIHLTLPSGRKCLTLNGNLYRRVDTPSVSYFCLTKGHALLGSWIHPCWW